VSDHPRLFLARPVRRFFSQTRSLAGRVHASCSTSLVWYSMAATRRRRNRRRRTDGACGLTDLRVRGPSVVIFCNFRHFVVFRSTGGTIFAAPSWCQRSARPPQTMDAVSRTVKSTPRGQATNVLAPSCAQRAQARGEGGVLSLIPNSQSTSAELLVLGRQDTICISAIGRFCEGAPMSNMTGTSSQEGPPAPRARAFVEGTTRMASTNATSPQSVANVLIALLRYCETDRKRQSLLRM